MVKTLVSRHFCAVVFWAFGWGFLEDSGTRILRREKSAKFRGPRALRSFYKRKRLKARKKIKD
jgi:hypothetical protein